MRRRSKLLAAAAIAAALAVPALAQESLLPPGFGNEQAPPAEQPQPTTNTTTEQEPAERARPRPRPDASAGEIQEVSEAELTGEELPPPPPPIEIPEDARRDPRLVGAIDPAGWGFGADPWGTANGTFLSVLMRRLETPLPSRWLHIALRNALLSRAEAPHSVSPVDWAAERAWLLLRMGEADAARMIVAGVDVADFTDKMTQVAVQTALATADPAGLCPLRERIATAERRIAPAVQAMCAALEGEANAAAAQIEQLRRRGQMSGIDHVLADKVVGAGEGTGRAVTVEWEPVEQLTAWRFGLSAATGLNPPERLFERAPARLRAWQARAPLLTPEQRLPGARIATGLGVFSSAALVDLYAQIYDATDSSDLSDTDAWRLRLAFVGRTQDDRLRAMRQLWGEGEGPVQRTASRALLALAATRIIPSPALAENAENLIASMLAGGYDREAGRWAGAVEQMDDAAADRAWALLALGTTANVDLSSGRIEAFIGRDQSPNRQRSKLLVAGLVGTGRIGTELAAELSQEYGLGLGRSSVWTRMVQGAGQRGQGGTAVLLSAVGMQASRPDSIPAAHMFRGLSAMRQSGLDFAARMIAAEALART